MLVAQFRDADCGSIRTSIRRVVAIRTGTIIHTIYTPGVGRRHHNYWEATSGQMGIAKLSGVTRGESFFLMLQMPVGIAPYLDQLQNILDNQYLLTVSAQPGKKTRLQNVAIDTEVAVRSCESTRGQRQA